MLVPSLFRKLSEQSGKWPDKKYFKLEIVWCLALITTPVYNSYRRIIHLPHCFSREVGRGGNAVVEPASVACFMLSAGTVRGSPQVEFIGVWIFGLALFHPVKIAWGNRRDLSWHLYRHTLTRPH